MKRFKCKNMLFQVLPVSLKGESISVGARHEFIVEEKQVSPDFREKVDKGWIEASPIEEKEKAEAVQPVEVNEKQVAESVDENENVSLTNGEKSVELDLEDENLEDDEATNLATDSDTKKRKKKRSSGRR